MCDTPNSNKQLKDNATPTTKQEPKWMRMKKLNKSSADKTAKPIVKKSSGSAQKPNTETRDQKRKRWAKTAKPVAKPVVKRGPVHEYFSTCCSLPAQKPVAGEKVTEKDPESGKMKTQPKGLGKWRCSGCKKICKVSRKAPAPKVVTVDMAKVEERAVASLSMPSAPDCVVVTGGTIA
jgi:hypothetical protein